MSGRRANSLVKGACAGVLVGIAAPSASAQVRAWMDLEGAIPGEATESRHEDWIELLGLGFGASRDLSAPSSTGGREGAQVSLAELTVSKYVDRASPALFIAAASGSEPIPKLTIDLNRGAKEPLARVELEDVLVTSQSFSAVSEGPPRPMETLALNFTRITFTYLLPDGGTLGTRYDLETAKATALDTTGDLTDSDGDGMADAWEEFYGLDPGVDDGDGDLDGDGLSNREEYELGTHPGSGSSFFRSTLSAAQDSPDAYEISWDSVPGKDYLIEWTPDLGTAFSTLRSVTASGSRTTEVVPRTGELGFFRVRTP